MVKIERWKDGEKVSKKEKYMMIEGDEGRARNMEMKNCRVITFAIAVMLVREGQRLRKYEDESRLSRPENLRGSP